MKILHVITTINLGGAENHLFSLVQEQVKSGQEVFVCYLKGDHYWRDQYEKLGVKTFCFEIESYFNLIPKSFILKKMINEYQPDILHAHMPPAELLCSLSLALGNKNSINYLASKHNDERFAAIPGGRFLGQWCFNKTKGVIAISEAVKSFIENQFHSRSQKIKKIYYGIDVKKFEQVSDSEILSFREQFINPGEFLIGTVARLTNQKSLETLIVAISELLKKDIKVKLIIVGEGEKKSSLVKLSRELGIDKKVHFLGKREDIPLIMKSLDVFVLTSIYEGLGLVLLEAQAAGCPVVASRVSAIPEVVFEGESGLFFESKNSTMCAERIESVIMNNPLKTRGQIQALVEENFSLASMNEKTLGFYRELV